MAFETIDVELIKDSTDTVSVIQRYVQLKKTGNSWKGLCPFHREKTPSFFVFPERGTWKCFGCGEGGDIITFLRKIRNLTFVEVVEELAEENGIALKRTSSGFSSERISKGLYAVIEQAHEFYSACFRKPLGKSARDYLQKRGIDDDALRIGVGYAPGANALLAHLRKLDFSVSTMAEAGLVITDRADPYDRFRNRLIFPIKDRRGRVVSFGARALGDALPKYLNGPETAVYKKGSFLYGYNSALSGARETGMVILVEGYFDHARLLSVGITGAVATTGTALTEKQARNLCGLSDRIYVCYDGDDAGRKAALKAAETILSHGRYPLLIRLPDKTDPDDFIKTKGKDAFLRFVESAYDPVSFGISIIKDKKLHGPLKIKATKRLLEIVSAARDPLVAEDLRKKVEKFSGFSRTALLRADEMTQKLDISSKRRVKKSVNVINMGDIGILRAATAGGRFDRDLIRFLHEDDMLSEKGREILRAFRKQMESGYSEVVIGEFDDDISSYSVDIVGFLESVSTEEIDKLKSAIEKKRRLRPMRRNLRDKLADADPEQLAIIMEELADGGAMHER